MQDFVHLHVHTEYSLLDGACRLQELIDSAIEKGQSALAITDHGVMYGAMEFYKKAKASGIKPIIGCEVYVAPHSRFDKMKERDYEYRHLVLLCKNMTGYQNLIDMVSRGFTEGFYAKPRIDMELLEKKHEGLIALSACLAGEVPKQLIKGNYDAAKSFSEKMNEIFGDGNFYLELQNHFLEQQERINPQIMRISKETGIPTVATNDVHYVEKKDSLMQKVLISIGTNKTLEDDNPLLFKTDEFYLKTGDEMAELFETEALENSVKIARECNLDFVFGEIKLPVFDIGDQNHFEFFKERCMAGLYKHYGEFPSAAVIERLNYELNMINQMGYVDYYLIVQDFVNYAKDKEIPVGPGRGSGAGSLAAYCIGITGIDPIKYNLLFERFLNPQRVSMPDFDIDFCYVRRQEVIDYVVSKYGADHVAQIVTFGTMAAKGAIRDVGRAMGVAYAVCDKVAKLIPFSIGMTINKAMDASTELKALAEEMPQVSELLEMAKKVEGMPRHASTHAAGVVITDKPVSEYVPLAKNDEAVVTQYSMTILDELGLLKMDFLGLRNLTVIADTEKALKSVDHDFCVEKIPMDDPKTMKMMSMGQTEGVFQFESGGMKNVLQSFGPQKLEDLIAIISLYRPGPMDSIPKYIYNRHHVDDIKYPTPLLKPILEVTYGCIVYQEQVMQIFRSLAGYSLGRADIVRRAMSKKKHEVMQQERKAFLFGDNTGNEANSCVGAIKMGVPQDVAEKIFDDMSAFSSYAFNKSHAAAYALVSYQTAYLKCHYPNEYMAALLTSVLDNTNKVSQYIAECNRLGIKVLPPHVNESDRGFSVSKQSIRFGLLAVKNLGYGLINQLLSERKNGEFTSIYDFCDRLYGRDLNKRAVESIIKSGALDGLGGNRRQMLQAMEPILKMLDEEKKYTVGGQLGFFATQTAASKKGFPLPECEEMPQIELLKLEKETTGMYLSGHPMERYAGYAKSQKALNICVLLDPEKNIGYDDKTVVLVGMVADIRKKPIRNNQTMAFVNIEDMTGSIVALLFSKMLLDSAEVLQIGKIVKLMGRVSVSENGEAEIVCNRLEAVSEQMQKAPIKKGLYLRTKALGSEEFSRAAALMQAHLGSIPVYVVSLSDNKRFAAPRQKWVDGEEMLLEELKKILGADNVIIK